MTKKSEYEITYYVWEIYYLPYTSVHKDYEFVSY